MATLHTSGRGGLPSYAAPNAAATGCMPHCATGKRRTRDEIWALVPRCRLAAAAACSGMRRRELLTSAASTALGAAAAATAAATVTTPAPPVASAGSPRGFALALGSGSTHGLAHIGVLRACEKLGLVPSLVVGSSIGAAVGALWAAGLDAAAIERISRSLDWTSVGSWTLSRRGLKRLDGLRRVVSRAAGGQPIEALPRRFAAVATALADGSRVVIDRGPVDSAVAASSAMPLLFVPVRLGGRDLVDGALSAPVPVDVARELGVDLVVAVDVAYRPSDAPPMQLGDIAFQTLHILVNALASEQVARADVQLRLRLHPLMSSKDGNSAVLIEAGERAMFDAAPRLRQRLQR